MTHISEHAPSDAFYIGIDGGGSKTLAIVVDAQGRECGRGQAGSSNYATIGMDAALIQLRNAAELASQAAGCQLPMRGAWLGLAGVDRPEDHALLSPHFQSFANVIHLSNDAELALSALDNAVGVALIAGTGSIALGRNAEGENTRAGGWGYAIGDEGSGYEIGRLALQAASKAADGRGPATLLLELILQHWHLKHASDMIGEVYPANDKAKIARLSSCVFIAARRGDSVAQQIMQQAASELARAVIVVSDILNFPHRCVPLALAGGLLIHEADYRTQVLELIGREYTIGQVALVEEPALSAARAMISLSQIKEH